MQSHYGAAPHKPPAHFGDVRAIAQGPPSAQAWALLVEAIDLWADVQERDALLVPYLRAHLSSWPDELRVASWPWLARIIERERSPCFELARAIDADHRVYRYSIKRMARRPALSLIRHLRLQSNGLDGALLRHLISSPHLSRLASLALVHNPLGAKGLVGLRDLERWDELRALTLQHVELDRVAALELSKNLALTQLSALSVAVNPLGADGLRALLSAGALLSLARFDVSHCHLHDDGARTLFAWRATPGLRALDLSCNGLSEPRTLEALTRAEFFSALRELSLGANFWRGDALALILRDAPAHALRRLNLSSVGLNGQSLALLLDASWMPEVTHLEIDRNGLGVEGLDALAAHEWPALESLSLASAGLTDEALMRFAQTAQLPALKHLILDKNRLRGGAIRALLEAPGLPALQRIDCRYNPVDPQTREALGPRVVWV